MNWTQILYGWGGLNEALFHLINGATPESLAPLVQFLTLAGSYWTTPAVMVGLWLCARRTSDERHANAINSALILFVIAYGVALITASLLKVTLAFPRPSIVFGDAIRVIGEADSQYSLPSGHATFSALVVSALWTMVNKRLRWILILYLVAVGWSRVAAGMHFPADVVAGWIVGTTSTQIAKRMLIWRSVKAPQSRRSPGQVIGTAPSRLSDRSENLHRLQLDRNQCLSKYKPIPENKYFAQSVPSRQATIARAKAKRGTRSISTPLHGHSICKNDCEDERQVDSMFVLNDNDSHLKHRSPR